MRIRFPDKGVSATALAHEMMMLPRNPKGETLVLNVVIGGKPLCCTLVLNEVGDDKKKGKPIMPFRGTIEGIPVKGYVEKAESHEDDIKAWIEPDKPKNA